LRTPLNSLVSFVVVKGKCQVLMFSDFVSPAPFKRLGLLSPHLGQAFAS
jgi:hypothetical protein